MSSKSIKKLQRILSGAPQHWVGDGFPVRTLFSYSHDGALLSPFLLLDYAGPVEFPPAKQRRGVGEHPHRGFETVTIVYDGEVEHRDSSGGGGIIGPGDVQWMTAGSGVVHEEFHGPGFAERGGRFEMIQLWINLPAKEKMTTPRYQAIPSNLIPSIDLPDAAGSLRIVSGDFKGIKGPAETFTPINVWDLKLVGGNSIDLQVPEGYTTLLLLRNGTVKTQGAKPIRTAEVGLFENTGDCIRLESLEDMEALLLCGKTINEPVVGSGPFVMNTEGQIRQAIMDYQNGKMGRLS